MSQGHHSYRAARLGTSPGTLIPSHHARPTEVYWTAYGPSAVVSEGPVAVDALPEPGSDAVVWIDVVGTADVAALEALGARFAVHPLALEDAVNVPQRPKLESYGDDLFLITHMVAVGETGTESVSEQLSILLRPGLVMTFQERPGDCFDRLRERLRRPTSRLRRGGADYLAYALLDSLIDGYQPVLDGYELRIEAIETRLLDEPAADDQKQLHTLRRELIEVRRRIAPVRDVVLGLMREPEAVEAVTEETRLFLRDCYDHVIRTVEQIDSFRELCASLMDLYMSTVSNRTNDVMKVLTMIATIFIPLSFMVGLYGMNFDTASPWNMPELSTRFGYPVLLTAMVVVTGGFLVYFKKKGWL